MKQYLGKIALGTWIAIALGFFVNPAFFLLGLLLFVVAAGAWTGYAIQEKVHWQTIALVWLVPIGMITFLGFALMFLPQLPSEDQ